MSRTPAENRVFWLLNIFLAVTGTAFAVFDGSSVTTGSAYSLTWPAYILLGSAFALNMTGRYPAAAMVFVLLFPATATLVNVTGRSPLPALTLSFLPLGILLGMIFFGLRAMLALSAVNLIALALNAAFTRDLPVSALAGSMLTCVIATAVTLFYIRHRDLTEAEKRNDLAEREEHLRLAMEAARLGAWTWNIQTGEIRWSGPTVEILGLKSAKPPETRDEYLGMLPVQMRSRMESALSDAASGYADRWAVEFEMSRPVDGKRVWIAERGRITRHADGRPLFIRGILVDFTERRLQEEKIRSYAEELERITYTASHDLRSPIVTIQSYLGFLREDLADKKSEEAQRDLELVGKAAKKMSALLDDLLEISRIGRMTNPPVTCRLSEVMHEAAEVVAGRLAAAGASVTIQADGWFAIGDRTRLTEVFQNLFDNAAKFTSKTTKPLIEAGVEITPEGPLIFVRDNGIGIDPRHQDRLFRMFEKIDPEVEGTGMGLAIVKRIIEFHGGRIRLVSGGLGTGTTFYFSLADLYSLTPDAAGSEILSGRDER